MCRVYSCSHLSPAERQWLISLTPHQRTQLAALAGQYVERGLTERDALNRAIVQWQLEHRALPREEVRA